MKKAFSLAVAAAFSATVLAAGVAPSFAMPLAPVAGSSGNLVEQVQYRLQNRHHHNRSRHDARRGWYHGYHGSRHHHRGWRRHSDGFWYPLAAFGLGAAIGGAIANSAPPAGHRLGSAHVRWCYDRYRSYRASDNTYQPYNGPRRQCYSPYN
jgi:hypothetical protein